MDNNLERWYSMKEIMEYLGVSRDTVLDWIERREMPAAKIGRLWKFKISEGETTFMAGICLSLIPQIYLAIVLYKTSTSMGFARCPFIPASNAA